MPWPLVLLLFTSASLKSVPFCKQVSSRWCASHHGCFLTLSLHVHMPLKLSNRFKTLRTMLINRQPVKPHHCYFLWKQEWTFGKSCAKWPEPQGLMWEEEEGEVCLRIPFCPLILMAHIHISWSNSYELWKFTFYTFSVIWVAINSYAALPTERQLNFWKTKVLHPWTHTHAFPTYAKHLGLKQLLEEVQGGNSNITSWSHRKRSYSSQQKDTDILSCS